MKWSDFHEDTNNKFGEMVFGFGKSCEMLCRTIILFALNTKSIRLILYILAKSVKILYYLCPRASSFQCKQGVVEFGTRSKKKMLKIIFLQSHTCIFDVHIQLIFHCGSEKVINEVVYLNSLYLLG